MARIADKCFPLFCTLPSIIFPVKTFRLTKARLIVLVSLPLLFASCASEFGCRARWTAAPIYPMTAADLRLRRAINKVNHAMQPLEEQFDRCAYPRRILKQIANLDEKVNHVNAELVLREVAPEKIERQLQEIHQKLARVEMEIAQLNGCFSKSR